ncbi:B-4DMT family transporter [Mycobacterium sp. CVI_P3]|uniref:B-4DMT family transporter n=1 Tax=Mycobacterium pinniadriaticum TaxID=2994102 RepID=A0ABT3SBV8_9MYCO|nr:B-4DMT family transporter [Mycobacterium pinniadriaticum]MCX2930314.1 B-4DMT family transporter [Mycobacterium pinniadriaticum]MCX2936624.1 B-4DMT family transporter [Mycobacterium pinniadriaticum]
MTTWMLRGLAFAAGMVIVRLGQGTLINIYETKAGLISIVLVALFGIGSFLWGLIDGRADANANPDPDRRRDLAMTWLLAGLVAGFVSGLITWVVSLFYKNVYAEGLISEITTFAAFTALMVFIPAIAAVAIGRFLVDRKRPDEPRRREDGSETDVFDAVREDERTGPIAGLGGTESATAAEEHTSAVATAERDEPTEQIHMTEGKDPDKS